MSPYVFANPIRRDIALVLLIAASIVLAWFSRFIVDDAFISFRYAQNLVSGEGLVWNPGERVEGYTNFLWTLLMAVPLAVNADVIGFAHAVGLLAAAGTLYFTFRFARLVCRSAAAALLTVLLLGTNYSFLSYATGGLETQLQTFLVVATAFTLWTALAGKSLPRFAAASLLAAAALLTRLDSAVAIFPAYAYVLWRVWRSRKSGAASLRLTAAAVLPAAAILGAWMVWKAGYYGDLLPNSYYAKAAPSVVSGWLGFSYLFHFLVSYLLFPFFVIGVWRARRMLATTGVRVLMVTVLLWSAYIVRVGGDFMEFRFVVPVLPFVMMLLVWLIVSFRRRIRVLLFLVVVAGSLWHALTFKTVAGIESKGRLKAHVVAPEENWAGVGEVLGDVFGGVPERVKIATTAAGAIPFYSGLETIDMFGINDSWIARNGVAWSIRPGHQRIATHRYLHDRGVNLVIGHPWVESAENGAKKTFTEYELGWYFRLYEVQPDLLPPGAGTIELPLRNGYRVTVLYLEPNEVVDRVIAGKYFKFNPLHVVEPDPSEF